MLGPARFPFGECDECEDSVGGGEQNVVAFSQCQGEVAACCGGWILITWCLARSVAAAFGLASMGFVGIRCEGPAGVT